MYCQEDSRVKHGNLWHLLIAKESVEIIVHYIGKYQIHGALDSKETI